MKIALYAPSISSSFSIAVLHTLISTYMGGVEENIG